MMPFSSKLCRSSCFIGFILIFWASTVESQDCSDGRYNNCTEPFLDGDPSNAVIPWYSKAVILDICRRLQVLTECMRTVSPYCSTVRQLQYIGLVDGYNYLCNSGYDDFVTYQQQCFSRPEVQSEGQDCVAIYSNRLITVFTSNYNSTYMRDRLCQFSDNYVDCVYNALSSYCNVGAATWQRNFDSKQLCPLLYSLKCPNWIARCSNFYDVTTTTRTSRTISMTSANNLSSSVIILLVSLIAFSIIIIGLAILCAVCVRVRRRKMRQTPTAVTVAAIPTVASYVTSIEQPPPYPGPFSCHGLPSTLPSTDGSWNRSMPASQQQTHVISNIDEALIDADVQKFTAAGRNSKVGIANDGFFVPDGADLDEKLEEVIPPPSQVKRQLHQNDDNEQTQNRSYGFASELGASPSSSASIPFGRHEHRRHDYRHHQPEAASSSSSSHDTAYWSSKSPVIDSNYFVGIGTSGFIPEDDTSYEVDARIVRDFSSSGTGNSDSSTPSSTHSNKLLITPSSGIASEISHVSILPYDDNISIDQPNDIDYY